ncbi:hypothetical protein [Nonomuraea sp. 10N515B]|uniref:hypothetical protein n=1 Tax=Nonomuraea sp. 10N515B TaxID=3457422 RepID=UPI003FCC6292
MHENTESRQPRTRSLGRVATLALATAAAGVMFLPVGQGVAGASTTATTEVSVSSHETPPQYCAWNYRCRYGWWRYQNPVWRYHPGWHHGNRDYYGRYYGHHHGSWHHYGDHD